MKIVITKRAQVQLDRIERWWHANRDKAPERFEDELEKAKEQLRDNPKQVKVNAVRGSRAIRSIVLPKTKVKLFFWINEKKGVVNILSAWGGKRERSPKL